MSPSPPRPAISPSRARGSLSVPWRCFPENVHLFIAGGGIPSPTNGLRKARRGRAYPFSRQGGGHARVVPAMDLFVLPSFYDACSNAVLEALACGLKVLSTTANGSSVFLPQEHVTPDPGDAEDLAARIRALIDEPAPAVPYSRSYSGRARHMGTGRQRGVRSAYGKERRGERKEGGRDRGK